MDIVLAELESFVHALRLNELNDAVVDARGLVLAKFPRLPAGTVPWFVLRLDGKGSDIVRRAHWSLGGTSKVCSTRKNLEVWFFQVIVLWFLGVLSLPAARFKLDDLDGATWRVADRVSLRSVGSTTALLTRVSRSAQRSHSAVDARGPVLENLLQLLAGTAEAQSPWLVL